MAEVKAQLNYLRIAPRKVRAVIGLIKDMDYIEAKTVLENTTKKAARPIMKLLDSAASNGYNNFNLVKENLYVKRILVDEGTKLKRFKAKGFGIPMIIQKKTSHITIILDERVKGMVRKKEEKKPEEKPVGEIKAAGKEKQAAPEIKKEIGRKGFLGNLKRKMFRRKSI